LVDQYSWEIITKILNVKIKMGNGCCSENERKDESSDFRAMNQESAPDRKTRATVQEFYIEGESAYDSVPESIDVEDPEKHKPTSPITQTQAENRLHPSVEQRLSKLLRQPNTAPPTTSHYPHMGPFKYPDDSTYLGQYNNGKREGFGQEILKDGSIYEGNWSNDKKNGNGRYVGIDGAVYTGDWVNGEKHGQGALDYVDGTGYNGGWSMGQISGKGRQKWPDGNIYQGDFMNGKKHGSGNFVWPDGNKFDGQYKNDIRDGFGKFTW